MSQRVGFESPQDLTETPFGEDSQVTRDKMKGGLWALYSRRAKKRPIDNEIVSEEIAGLIHPPFRLSFEGFPLRGCSLVPLLLHPPVEVPVQYLPDCLVRGVVSDVEKLIWVLAQVV